MKRWLAVNMVTAAAVCACGGMVMQPDGGTATPVAGGMTAGGAATAGGTAGGTAAAGGTAGGLAMAGGTATYPSWQLVDLQPMSPRANETYGLGVFQGRPVVAYLIEGF